MGRGYEVPHVSGGGFRLSSATMRSARCSRGLTVELKVRSNKPFEPTPIGATQWRRSPHMWWRSGGHDLMGRNRRRSVAF
jgi:hypothetical protein